MDYNDFLAGVVQASLATAIGYPFEIVKSRMQSNMYPQGVTSWGCFQRTVAEDGLRSLYRGGSLPLISHMIKRPVQFMISEHVKKKRPNDAPLTNYLIGGATGVFGPIFGTPLQVVKISSQTSMRAEHGRLRELAQQIWTDRGVRGFYRGLVPNLAKDSLFGMSFIGTYYTLRDLWGNDRWYKNFASGSLAHSFTWLVLIPIDHVKTNMQKLDGHSSVVAAIRHVVVKEGIIGLWRGVVPACVRAIPVSGVALTGYEMVRNNL